MQILFSKIIHFTRLIKAGGRLREFNIRKIKEPGKELFSIDTVDDRGNRIIFRMAKEGNGPWNIVSTEQPLPAWMADTEPRLSETIEQELQSLRQETGR